MHVNIDHLKQQHRISQAIFSLHRGDAEKAKTQLRDATAIAQEIWPTVQANPSLRPGSYSSALEELGEALVFQVFLEERRLASRDEMPLLNAEEFLGGVLDFTGELNRYAVQRATARDVEEVQRCKVGRSARGREF